MGGGIRITLDPSPFTKRFRRLKREQIEPLVARAVSQTAFEVADAERKDVATSGLNFVSNAKQFLLAHRVIQADHYSGLIEAHVMPRGSGLDHVGHGERILLDHQQPKTIRFNKAADALRIGGLNKELAIPANNIRGRGGRVSPRDLPTKLVERERSARGRGKKRRTSNNRTFPILPIGGNKLGIFTRDRSQAGGGIRLAFVLQKSAPLKTGPLNFHNVARAIASVEFPKKMKRAFDRVKG